MPRVARLYVPLSVSFFMNDKTLAAGEEGAWLYLRMLAMSKSLDSDGRLTRRQIDSLGIIDWVPRLERLLEARSVVVAEQSAQGIDFDTVYAITGWLEWNESAADRAERLRVDRERKQNRTTRSKKAAGT